MDSLKEIEIILEHLCKNYPERIKSDDLRDKFNQDIVDMLGSRSFFEKERRRSVLYYRLSPSGFDLLSSLRLNNSINNFSTISTLFAVAMLLLTAFNVYLFLFNNI